MDNGAHPPECAQVLKKFTQRSTRTRSWPVQVATHVTCDCRPQKSSLNPIEPPPALLYNVMRVSQVAPHVLNTYILPVVTAIRAYWPAFRQGTLIEPGHGGVMVPPASNVLLFVHCENVLKGAQKSNNAPQMTAIWGERSRIIFFCFLNECRSTQHRKQLDKRSSKGHQLHCAELGSLQKLPFYQIYVDHVMSCQVYFALRVDRHSLRNAMENHLMKYA